MGNSNAHNHHQSSNHNHEHHHDHKHNHHHFHFHRKSSQPHEPINKDVECFFNVNFLILLYKSFCYIFQFYKIFFFFQYLLSTYPDLTMEALLVNLN